MHFVIQTNCWLFYQLLLICLIDITGPQDQLQSDMQKIDQRADFITLHSCHTSTYRIYIYYIYGHIYNKLPVHIYTDQCYINRPPECKKSNRSISYINRPETLITQKRKKKNKNSRETHDQLY